MASWADLVRRLLHPALTCFNMVVLRWRGPERACGQWSFTRALHHCPRDTTAAAGFWNVSVRSPRDFDEAEYCGMARLQA